MIVTSAGNDETVRFVEDDSRYGYSKAEGSLGGMSRHYIIICFVV